MLNRQQTAVPDIYADPRIPHEAYRPTFVKSLAMTPIRKDDPIGAIGAYWADFHQATAEELETLQALGDSAAMAIGTAQMIQALREANHRKDSFLSMLAHELRNPLAPIRNGLHVLRLRAHEGEDEVADRTRDLVERQIQLLTRIVDGLLDVARISKGQVTLHRERIDLARLIRESAEDRRGLLESTGIELDLGLPPAPLWIQGDSLRLAQALGNILDNAGKFIPKGGRITVRLETDGRQAVVTLRDNGIGIEPEVLPHIFETFTQGHQPLDRSQGGLGLGLAVARELLELHGGKIEAASEGPGKGAEFTLRIPCEEELPEPAHDTEPGPPGKEPRRILVVEDNRDAAESLGLFLELCGFGVTLAYTGPEGLEAAKSMRPDIVLCDIGLPGMDGFQVAGALRRNPETAEVRLIAVTGYGQEEDRRRALAAGFDVHLVKPVDPEKLLGYLA
jgi:signal transduction histidine kinase/CheY-like chemotaxis protein